MKKKYKEVRGNLIELALQGHFDVVVQGCNCFNKQGAGISGQFVKHWKTDTYHLETTIMVKPKEKLGMIEIFRHSIADTSKTHRDILNVVNAYTQYKPGRDLKIKALERAFKTLNDTYPGKVIGIPEIGCGIAGEKWKVVREVIQNVTSDCYIRAIIPFDYSYPRTWLQKQVQKYQLR